jgi:hypothetical protein
VTINILNILKLYMPLSESPCFPDSEGGGGNNKEKKWKRERLWEIRHIFFALLFTACGCMKLLRCYFHNPQIAFLDVLLGIWYIGFQYIYIIYSAVFVVEMQYFEKMNSA